MPFPTNVRAGIALVRRHPQGTLPCARTSSWPSCVGALALPLAACNDPKDTATVAQSYGPSPTLPPPEHSWIPTVNIATVNRWPDGAKPTAANGMTVNGVRDRARASALALRAAERRRAGRRDQRAAEAGRRQGHQGLDHEAWCMKRAGAGVPSANRITLLRDADGDGVAETRSVFLERAEFAVRHGAGRRRFLCRQYRCDHAIPLPRRATPRSPRPASSWPTCRPAPINHHWTKNLIASPDGTQALRDRRLQQQRRRERHRGREGPRRGAGSRPRQRQVARVRVRPAQSRTACRGSRRPARCGSSSTSATNSATISCPTT